MISRFDYVPANAPPNAPYPVAYEMTVPTEQMVELVKKLVPRGSSVLEIGSGSGYLATCMSEWCGNVTGIDVQHVNHHVMPFNVQFVKGDGRALMLQAEAFDCIVVSFAAEKVYPAWIRQLKVGGRLIVPLKIGTAHPICLFVKEGRLLQLVDIAAYARFTSELKEN